MKKVVPVILRQQNQVLEILAFQHPLAGSQLVKGTIELYEKYDEAAIRELSEESGVIAEPNPKFIGNFTLKSNQQNWYFYLCELRTDLAETWIHHCQDGGGLDFKFFWYPLNQKPNESWHGSFQEALAFLRDKLIM
ncbi:NUDIX domain-containing protein [Acinetobacter sp. C26M]|uniref:NUDIX hydrolase n=1 Tax=unclassified Acinetobacter TaxID=196816 RepID=UPI002036FC28|nr:MULTISPECIES: NUDIX domain-containing protein [unclassified Acinetobacter]USA47678.1 NUDIX domain-containing protein [Acinetobacter sp. C26M]USA51159.1 NUDIX domain-containing protein [Acinetobacter sp. C26G]